MRTRLLVAGAMAVALPPGGAEAANWRASSGDSQARAYIDTDSIRREGERVSFWRELRWPEVRTLGDGTRYNRLGSLYEADCAAMTLRSITVRANLDENVVLSGEGSRELEQARPGTTAETDLRSVCFGEWPER